MPARLFVVATPIGHLDDITLRAISTLKSVALIAAEDTRRTGTLLRHFGITTPTTSYHAHNERQKLPLLLSKLQDGLDLALVSDAGTPLVADPGQRLIAAAIEAGAVIVPIPGPSAVLAALSVAGLGADEFVFCGFAPARSKDLETWLLRVVSEPRPVVFFEAPHRIRKTLVSMGRLLGKRQIIITRELTKIHEQVVRTTADAAPVLSIPEKGEFTIVVAGKGPEDRSNTIVDDRTIYEYFCQLTNNGGLARRLAVSRTGQFFGLSTNVVYLAVERAKSSAP